MLLIGEALVNRTLDFKSSGIVAFEANCLRLGNWPSSGNKGRSGCIVLGDDAAQHWADLIADSNGSRRVHSPDIIRHDLIRMVEDQFPPIKVGLEFRSPTITSDQGRIWPSKGLERSDLVMTTRMRNSLLSHLF